MVPKSNAPGCASGAYTEDTQTSIAIVEAELLVLVDHDTTIRPTASIAEFLHQHGSATRSEHSPARDSLDECAVKYAYGPDNVFHLNQNIRPTRCDRS